METKICPIRTDLTLNLFEASVTRLFLGVQDWGANSPLGGHCVSALHLAMFLGNLAQAKTMVAHRTLLYLRKVL